MDKNVNERHSKGVHLAIKDFKCDICDQAFSEKRYLTVHVNSVHKNLTGYSCDLCEYSSVFGRNFFLSKNQLFILEMDCRANIKYKKKKVKKNFKCENKKFCF
jgi:hypothetical protein